MRKCGGKNSKSGLIMMLIGNVKLCFLYPLILKYVVKNTVIRKNCNELTKIWNLFDM